MAGWRLTAQNAVLLYNDAVLRTMFGPSQKEIWRQLSAEMPATFVEGGFLRSDKVQATHGEWTVTLDKYVVHTGKVTIVYTRMRAPYVNPDGFRFRVYRKGVFSQIGKMFGMPCISDLLPSMAPLKLSSRPR